MPKTWAWFLRLGWNPLTLDDDLDILIYFDDLYGCSAFIVFLGKNKSIIGLVGRGCNSMNSQEVFFFRCFEIGCANRYCIHSFHAKQPMSCSIVTYVCCLHCFAQKKHVWFLIHRSLWGLCQCFFSCSRSQMFKGCILLPTYIILKYCIIICYNYTWSLKWHVYIILYFYMNKYIYTYSLSI